MIRDIISNDLLTILLFCSLFLVIFLKKIEPTLFYLNLSLRKKELRNKLINNSLSIRLTDICYKILFLSNISILITFYQIKYFDHQIYFKLLKIFSIFYLFKILIDFLIGILFNVKKNLKNYIYSKLIYRNSLGLIILLFNFFIAYSYVNNHIFISISITFSLFYLIFSYTAIFFSMKKVIIKNWFYFILYLCTLEIIPYYYLISNVL